MKGHKDGYERTAASARSQAGFRRTLGRQGSALRICPPDYAGKRAGSDHWQPWPKAPKR